MSEQVPQRKGRRYLRLCATVRAQAQTNGDPCWLCGQPIDFDAVPRTRWSFSLDHVLSLVHGGDLLDPTNARPAHYGCNSKRGGATRRGRMPLMTSRAW